MNFSELDNIKYCIENEIIFYCDIDNYLQKKGKYLFDKIYYQRRLMRSFIVNRLITNQGFIYYSTFTLNDNHLNNFNRESFNKYLRRNNVDYILINDYGDLFNRLHFHGFIWSQKELNNDCLNHYGFVNFKLIDENCWEKSVYYCVKYAVKFNFDSFKIMYSYKNFKNYLKMIDN